MAAPKPVTPLERKQIWSSAFGAHGTTTQRKKSTTDPTVHRPPPPQQKKHLDSPAVRTFISNTLQQLETMAPTTPPEPNPATKSKTAPPSKPPNPQPKATKTLTLPQPNPPTTTETSGPHTTTEKIDSLIIRNIFDQLNHLFTELSKYTPNPPLNNVTSQMKSTLTTMEKILLHGQDPHTPIPPLSASYSDTVTSNMHKYQDFNSGSRKRARRESPEKQTITPIVIENFQTPQNPFTSNHSILQEIQKHKPQAKLQKLVHMRNGNILIFPSDIHSLNTLLSPWPENSFNKAQFTCRLARKQGNTPPPDTTAKVLVIKGIHTDITEEQIKQELETQGINITKLHRIISRATQQPTSFIKIFLTNPEQSAGLLHEGFYMHLFQYRVEKARPPPTTKQCYKCQQFNHISTHCTNPVTCVRCGENHHHKICNKQKNQATCTNCKGNHSAASKSCPVYLSHMTPSSRRPPPATQPTTSTNPSSQPTASQPPNHPLSQPTTTQPTSQHHSKDTDFTHLHDDLRKLNMDQEKINQVLNSIRKHTNLKV